MINVKSKTLLSLLLITAVFSISACSTIDNLQSKLNDKAIPNYQNNQEIKMLEIPPDLTAPEFDKSFELPKGVISAASLNSGGSGLLPGTSASGSNEGFVRSGDLSIVKTVSGRSVLQINDTYPRAKIITEIMLSRMGFSTVSKSAAGDLITARYNGTDVTVNGSRPGLFSRAIGLVGIGKSDVALASGESYRVSIKNDLGAPVVRFERASGAGLSDASHAKIISLLNTAFNR